MLLLCITAHSPFHSVILTGNSPRLLISFNYMKSLHSVAFILLVVGGLNWLLVGLFDWNIVDTLGIAIAKIVYVLVGVSALYLITTHKRDCKQCMGGGM